MEMKKLKIKAEYMATRCEICHQADLWDPFKEECERCFALAIYQKPVSVIPDMAIPSLLSIDRQRFIAHPRWVAVICMPVILMLIVGGLLGVQYMFFCISQLANFFELTVLLAFYAILALTFMGMEIISVITLLFLIKVMIYDEY